MRPSMNKKCEVCEPVLVGLIWECDGAVYTREMLRKCSQCRREMLSDLTWVDTNFPTCGACLSQDLRLLQDGELECTECGSRTMLKFYLPEDS